MTEMNQQHSGPGMSDHDHSQDSTGHSMNGAKGGHGGHNWMMMACCVPMIVIALGLVLAGVVSVSFLIYAVACLGMMFMMMRMMDHGGMKM
jgi:hypothetical protein